MINCNRYESISANGKDSLHDFELYVFSRNISPAPKVENYVTVPGMHGSYDFSSIFGEVIYNDRSISYTFDIIADDISSLDKYRREVMDWLCNINNTRIIDTADPDHYWLGSYKPGTYSESGLQGQINVSFIVYPYAIAINPTVTKIKGIGSKTLSCNIFNTSSHKVSPTIETTSAIKIKHKNAILNISPGKYVADDFLLEKGDNLLQIVHDTQDIFEVVISYYEEVM